MRGVQQKSPSCSFAAGSVLSQRILKAVFNTRHLSSSKRCRPPYPHFGNQDLQPNKQVVSLARSGAIMDQAEAKAQPAHSAVNSSPELGARSVLTASQKAQFDRDGFIIVKNLLDQVRLQRWMHFWSPFVRFCRTLCLTARHVEVEKLPPRLTSKSLRLPLKEASVLFGTLNQVPDDGPSMDFQLSRVCS